MAHVVHAALRRALQALKVVCCAGAVGRRSERRGTPLLARTVPGDQNERRSAAARMGGDAGRAPLSGAAFPAAPGAIMHAAGAGAAQDIIFTADFLTPPPPAAPQNPPKKPPVAIGAGEAAAYAYCGRGRSFCFCERGRRQQWGESGSGWLAGAAARFRRRQEEGVEGGEENYHGKLDGHENVEARPHRLDADHGRRRLPARGSGSGLLPESRCGPFDISQPGCSLADTSALTHLLASAPSWRTLSRPAARRPCAWTAPPRASTCEPSRPGPPRGGRASGPRGRPAAPQCPGREQMRGEAAAAAAAAQLPPVRNRGGGARVVWRARRRRGECEAARLGGAEEQDVARVVLRKRLVVVR